MKLRLEMKEYELYDEEHHDVHSSESDSELLAVLSYSQSNPKGKKSDLQILDKVLYNYIELKKGPEEIINQGFEKALVNRVLKMVNTNEYKRFQTPPMIRVSTKAFGLGRRMPLVGKYLS